MSLATTTFTINPWPQGLEETYNMVHPIGTLAVSAGQYPGGGIPISFNSPVPGYNPTPFFATLYSPTTGNDYQFDPVNQKLRIFLPATYDAPITTSAFSASTGWGGSTYPPTLVLASPSTQRGGGLTVETNASGTTGSNPTITYTFPQPYSQPPVVGVSRGNDSALTAGYWAVEDASTTVNSVIFEFVGTPTAGDNYVLDFIVADVGTNAAAAVVAGSFALSSGWGTAAAATLENSASTQGAFSLNVAAGSAATGSNPTITLTFPVPYSTAPQFTVSDGVLRPTTGHWAFTGSTTTTASFSWIGTPTATDVYILDAIAHIPRVPAVTTAAFALSSGFGATATTSVIGNEMAFQLTIAVSGSGIGANPTATLTLPTALGQTPSWVVSRGDTDANAGYWAVEDASSTGTTLIVKFVGTPVTAHTYALNAIGVIPPSGPKELATGATIPATVVTDTIYISATTTRV